MRVPPASLFVQAVEEYSSYAQVRKHRGNKVAKASWAARVMLSAASIQDHTPPPEPLRSQVTGLALKMACSNCGRA